MAGKVRIAVLASGRGSNFKAIADAVRQGACAADILLLITNNPEAPAIAIAKEHGIPVEVVSKDAFPKRSMLDDQLKALLDRNEIDLVVLAGYMLLIKGKPFLEAYRMRIINIHPSLLPAFPGEDAQKQAFDYGAKVSGVTIHFVDETLDGGPIIHQEAVDISGCRSAEEAAERILEREHKAYPKIIDNFSKGRYEVEGRRTRFIPHGWK